MCCCVLEAILFGNVHVSNKETHSFEPHPCLQLCTLYDFLPEQPTALSTAAALLSGLRVPGVVRERTARLPRRCIHVGHAAAPQACCTSLSPQEGS